MPTEVVIVQDRKSIGEALTLLFGALAGRFLTAWVVMLLLPYFSPWSPNYWQVFAALIVVGALHPNYSQLVALYTRKPRY